VASRAEGPSLGRLPATTCGLLGTLIMVSVITVVRRLRPPRVRRATLIMVGRSPW